MAISPYTKEQKLKNIALPVHNQSPKPSRAEKCISSAQLCFLSCTFFQLSLSSRYSLTFSCQKILVTIAAFSQALFFLLLFVYIPFCFFIKARRAIARKRTQSQELRKGQAQASCCQAREIRKLRKEQTESNGQTDNFMLDEADSSSATGFLVFGNMLLTFQAAQFPELGKKEVTKPNMSTAQ